MLSLRVGMKNDRDEVIRKLVDIQYERNEIDFRRGRFRARGDVLEVFPANSSEKAIRVEFFGDEIERITEVDYLTGEVIGTRTHIAIFPASHYATTRPKMEKAMITIEKELEERLEQLKMEGKLLEAQRLEQRTRYDLEMMSEIGFCQGIENYSKHISGRKSGSSPFTLMDYFPKDYLLFIDESHVTVSQVGAMYSGDRSRKESLVDYGFRLPSAFDNRPLKFNEWEERINQVIYVSATPAVYEKEHSTQIVEQIIRPTGLIDPEIIIRPVKGQIDDLIGEIYSRAEKKQRVLVTTLTKKMSEDLTDYMKGLDIKVKYLHSDVATFERMEIIRDLRLGVFDVLIGINLLREGLDLPEVTLVAILDADKEGFLRSETSLIQTMGRAARNSEGKVIMYADKITGSMHRAMSETNRRRQIQMDYNIEHGIVPTTIVKSVRDRIEATKVAEEEDKYYVGKDPKIMSVVELDKLIAKLHKDMKQAASDLQFEKAAELRDKIHELRERL